MIHLLEVLFLIVISVINAAGKSCASKKHPKIECKILDSHWKWFCANEKLDESECLYEKCYNCINKHLELFGDCNIEFEAEQICDRRKEIKKIIIIGVLIILASIILIALLIYFIKEKLKRCHFHYGTCPHFHGQKLNGDRLVSRANRPSRETFLEQLNTFESIHCSNCRSKQHNQNLYDINESLNREFFLEDPSAPPESITRMESNCDLSSVNEAPPSYSSVILDH